MNEKLIGDLFVEAQRQMTGHGSKEFSEKFAELIIKECADISDASFHNGSAGYTAILKHFGVEE